AKDSEFLNDTFQVVDVPHMVWSMLNKGAVALGELPQGFDLSINLGYSYPFCTSRDITPMQFMNDIGLGFAYLGDVYGVIRTFPIRVGNTQKKEILEELPLFPKDDYFGENEIGYSGDYYADQNELTWEKVSEYAGHSVKELTSVTK